MPRGPGGPGGPPPRRGGCCGGDGCCGGCLFGLFCLLAIAVALASIAII